MKKIYGNHLGLVISGGDEDPEGRGRCQIFIPHISNTLYKSWNQELNDIEFMTLAQLSGMGDVIKRLKQTLPWAECAAPIFGGSTNIAHNPHKGTNAPTYPGTVEPPVGANFEGGDADYIDMDHGGDPDNLIFDAPPKISTTPPVSQNPPGPPVEPDRNVSPPVSHKDDEYWDEQHQSWKRNK